MEAPAKGAGVRMGEKASLQGGRGLSGSLMGVEDRLEEEEKVHMLDDYGLAWGLGAPVGAKVMCIAWQGVQSPRGRRRLPVCRHWLCDPP